MTNLFLSLIVGLYKQVMKKEANIAEKCKVEKKQRNKQKGAKNNESRFLILREGLSFAAI